MFRLKRQHWSRTEECAFGSQKTRFIDPAHDLPGPGAYFSPVTLIKDSDSISRKGYGSLSSAAFRWQGIKPQWTGPGPGEYEAAIAPPSAVAAVYNRADTSANFHRPYCHSGRRKGERERGPGTYEHMCAHFSGTAVKWVNTPHTGQTSAFKAVPRHTPSHDVHNSPGAGSYELSKVSVLPNPLCRTDISL